LQGAQLLNMVIEKLVVLFCASSGEFVGDGER